MPLDFNELVLAEMPDGIVITDPDGRVLHWTHGAEQLFGYTNVEAVGQILKDLIIPTELADE